LACSKKGEYEIHDYKTGGSLPTQAQADEDRQLALYQAAVQNDYKDARKVKLVWHYVAFNKDVESTRSKKDIKQVKKDAVQVIKQIERAQAKNRFPAEKSALCAWCGFRSLCPQWKHVIKLEFLPANEFAKDSGVQLASKYAELKQQEALVKSKLEQLREAIISFAKKEGVEVIVGKDCKVSVKTGMVEKLPSKGSEEREKLDALVKKTGKWLDVSDLNSSLLKQALEKGVFDEKTVKAIEKLQQMQEETRIYLRDHD
jgi:putative RecB family exonuclease